MRLDKNKNDFTNLIVATNSFTGFDYFLIEKDFYVTLLLKEASKKNKGFSF